MERDFTLCIASSATALTTVSASQLLFQRRLLTRVMCERISYFFSVLLSVNYRASSSRLWHHRHHLICHHLVSITVFVQKTINARHSWRRLMQQKTLWLNTSKACGNAMSWRYKAGNGNQYISSFMCHEILRVSWHISSFILHLIVALGVSWCIRELGSSVISP